ncbi:MAG: AbrB/MazE/SpoVT family DNA-binding domain-containing protein [Dehalococcoidia bacterium]
MPRQATIKLRPKNQVTLPKAIAEYLGVGPGDRLILMVDEQTRTVRLRPLHRSYAGLLAGVYGTSDEAKAYIRGGRASWDE